MSSLKRIVLDILKPHKPKGVEFSRALADLKPGYYVKYKVVEVDDMTETVIITLEGDDIDFELIRNTIKEMGGSLHSVDEIEIVNEKSDE